MDIAGGAGVCTSTGTFLFPLLPLLPPESSGAIVGLLVTGAAVGADSSTGVGIGAADTLKSQSMSPPISKSSGTQHGQSTKGTCGGVFGSREGVSMNETASSTITGRGVHVGITWGRKGVYRYICGAAFMPALVSGTSSAHGVASTPEEEQPLSPAIGVHIIPLADYYSIYEH